MYPALSKLKSHTGFPYFISVAATMMVQVAQVIILVRIYSPAIFASFVLTKTSLLLVTTFANMGMSQAVVKWIAEKHNERSVLSTALATVLALSVPAALLLGVILYILGSRTGFNLNVFSSMLVLLVVCLHLVWAEFINFFRARADSISFAHITIQRSVLQLAVIYVFALQRPDTLSYLEALVLADLILFAVVLPRKNQLRIDFSRVQWNLAWRMLQYGWPHAVVIVSGVLLHGVDRYFLSYLSKAPYLVAYYDAAYTFVSASLALLIRPFNLYIFPAYLKRHSLDGRESTSIMMTAIIQKSIYAFIAVATVVVLSAKMVLSIVFPEGYAAAASICAPVAVGIIMNGLFVAAVAGIYVSQKTILVAYATFGGLLINVILNFILIPIYGADGAAYATLCAYMAQLITAEYFARTLLPIRFPWKQVFALSAVLLVLGSINYRP